MAPPSQKTRRIGFNLTGGAEADARFDFYIRPEDLTRQEGSRLAVQQTLGGAWMDSFGRNLSTITLAGHNGWRGGFLATGEDLFQELRTTCFTSWHDRRAKLVQDGKDPRDVRLTFVDLLDNISTDVAPKAFTLRRSKSSPLLMRFQIILIEVDDTAELGLIDSIVAALSNPLRWLAGVTGLGNVVSAIRGYVTDAVAVLGAARAGAAAFLGLGADLLSSVASVAQEVRGTFEGADALLYSTGLAYASAGRNAFAALAGEPSLPLDQRFALMQVAGAFADAQCTLNNSFNVNRSYPSFDDLYGASNCSSTGGGRAWSTFAEERANPFASMYPPTTPRLTVNSDASAAITTLRGDPLALVGDQTRIGSLLGAAAGGVVLS